MTAVTYTAKRSLIAGHVALTTYSLDLATIEGYPLPTRKVGLTVQRTLNDRAERMYEYGKRTWQVQALVRNATEWVALREFLESTEGGESFSFDEFGSVAAPGTLVTCWRTTPGYSVAPIAGTGASPADDALTVTFDLEQA